MQPMCPWVRDWLKMSLWSSVPMWLYHLSSLAALTSPPSTCAYMCPYFQNLVACNRCYCVCTLAPDLSIDRRPNETEHLPKNALNKCTSPNDNNRYHLFGRPSNYHHAYCILYRSMILIFTEIGNVIYLSEFDRSVQPMVTAEVWD